MVTELEALGLTAGTIKSLLEQSTGDAGQSHGASVKYEFDGKVSFADRS